MQMKMFRFQPVLIEIIIPRVSPCVKLKQYSSSEPMSFLGLKTLSTHFKLQKTQLSDSDAREIQQFHYL